MTVKTRNWLKSICLGLLVALSSAYVYGAVWRKTGSVFNSVAISIVFFLVASGLGLSFGLLISLFARQKVSEEGRPSVALRWALWFCLWLVPASVIGTEFFLSGSNLLRSFGCGAAWGAGIALFIIVTRAGIRSGRRARLSSIMAGQEAETSEFYDEFDEFEDYEEAESADTRPFGSVEEAFRPKFEFASECVICGKQHGLAPGVMRKWHRCTGCGNIYCDECGSQLPGKRGFLEAERTCPDCGSRTTLI